MSIDRALLAAVLVLLWIRPYTSLAPEALLVDIGVLILLYLAYPQLEATVWWMADWVNDRRATA